MATCAKCGAALPDHANFCASCGARAGTSQVGTTAGAAEIPSNIAALLCYIFWPVTSALFLILGPYRTDKFVRFHAYQALYLGLFGIGLGIALRIPTTILKLIPVLGGILNFLIWMVYGAGIFGLVIFVVLKAYRGEEYRIPVIGMLAAKKAEKQG
ncbi:MAG TPA: zinc-ribbon domain-containing protein [Terriglobia bacterium]|nr:zinc-ribbon domain-containing protein [Terriglobia bacterium]